MKRGIGEEKVIGPMFPRLHVNDTGKGGPRAPPRNKMALYEQLGIPSQRYNSGDLPLNDNTNANLVPPHSSQENEHERGLCLSRQLPALRHPVEKPHGSNKELNEMRGRITRHHGKSQNRDNSKERVASTEDYSKGTSDSLSMDKREGISKQTDRLLHFKPRENLVSTFGESRKTNIVQLESKSDSRVDCTVFSGSVIDVDNDSEEENTCKSSQTGEMDRSDGVSETSVVEFVSEMDISPDDVVRMIGQKHFWKARRAIANQQRVLAVQVFELHRLLKVQKLIAGSPNVNLEDTAYLGKPLKTSSAKRICLEHSVKAPENVSLPKNDSEKPKARMECNSVHDGSQPSSCRPPLPKPVKYDSFVSPLCFNQPPGHQWLIPMMSPSEGLVYKPLPGPAVISPVYGGLTPMTGNFLVPACGLHFAPATGHGYFRPFGMPVMNPASNQVATTRSQGQLSGEVANLNIQHQNSSNIGNENDGTVPGVVRLYPSRDSELQASTSSSPSGSARGVDVGNSTGGRSTFHLFPTSPAIDNLVLRPQPHFPNRPARAIKVVPHNARSATESAARIFRSIQEERKQY